MPRYPVYDYTFLLKKMLAALKQMEEFHRSDKAMCAKHLDTADEIGKAIGYIEELLTQTELNNTQEDELIQEAFAYIGQYLTGWWD
jgi:hypothetical protein